MASIKPDAKALILCDFVERTDNGKVTVHGIFNAVRPTAPYPFTLARICVFVQLVGGHGLVPFRVEVRQQEAEGSFRATQTNVLNFPSRTSIVRVAQTITDCVFQEPGVYVVDLLCDNEWVCDASLLLLEAES